MHTLNSIQNVSGINRGQLAKVAEDLGIATGRGITISDEDRDRLVDEAKRRSEARLQALIQANTPKGAENDAEPAGQLQVIQPGINYTSAPIVPTNINLAALGFEPVQSLEDPMAVAQALIQAIDATEQGLGQHLSHLSDRATKTKAAAKALADRRRQFERSLDKAELLAAQHQGSLSEAEDALAAEAAALGKSSAAAA